MPDADLSRQREIVNAFLSASRGGFTVVRHKIVAIDILADPERLNHLT